jgi:hypothetical protein
MIPGEPPTVPPPPAAPVEPPRAQLRARLRERLPEILIEAASVTAAVLLALGVDAWRERLREQEAAERALAALRLEAQENRRELRGALEKARATRARLQPLAAAEEWPPEVRLDLGLEIAMLSRAGWDTAQATGALPLMGVERSVQLAGVYELQRWLERAQERAFDALSAATAAAPARDDAAFRTAVRRFDREVATLIQLGEALDRAYGEQLRPGADAGSAVRP